MKVYGSNALRNVAFVGHGGSGKTSLVDALAFVSGSSRRHGSIKDGTTLTDNSPDEIERKHSISLGLAYAEWMDTKVNLIDTPGYLDYFGEVVTGVYAADAAVVVLGSTAGVEVGTEKAWEVCDRLHLPRMLFVSGMDKEHADFERVYQDVKAHLSPNVVPVEVPIGDGRDFQGIINLFSGHCHMYQKGTKSGEYDVVACPPEYQDRFSQYTEQFTESVASTDDALIERYLGGEEIPREEFIAAVKRGMLQGAIVPLFCGSAELTYGVRALLKKMVELFPSPAELTPPVDAPLAARVFKTVSEPHVGDVTLFRLFTGDLRNGDDVWNAEHELSEKLNHLSVQQGRERIEVERLCAGDIGSVAKLKNTHTNDTFCRRDHPVRLPPVPFPEAVATAAVVVKQRGEEDKLAAGLHRIHEEDPTFHFEYSSELGQTLIHGMGERHFETILGRLERKFGVHAELVRPRVAYRETLRARAAGQAQEAVGRARTVRRLLGAALTAAAGAGLRLRGLDRGRRHPEQVHSGGGPRRAGGGGARRRGRLPDGGLQGRVLRRLVPRRGLERDVVQDGRHPGVQERGAQVPAGAPRAAGRGPRLDPRRRPRRRHGRPQRAAGADPRHRSRRPAHQGAGDRAGGGALPLLDDAALDHAWSRHAPVQAARLCRCAAGGHREGRRGE